MCKVNLVDGWNVFLRVFFFFFFFPLKILRRKPMQIYPNNKRAFFSLRHCRSQNSEGCFKSCIVFALPPLHLRQHTNSHYNMDRKRVPGPELSVAPLVEYPVDRTRWTPQKDQRHDSSRQPEDMRPICTFLLQLSHLDMFTWLTTLA